MDTQVSTTRQSASPTMASRSSLTTTSPPLAAAQSRISADGAQGVGAGEAQGEAEARRRVNPRDRHVVAVAGPGDHAPGDGPQVLLEGHDVGHQLAGMGAVGQAVDDRHRGVFGKLEQLGVLGGADHHHIDVARQHPRRIGDGLAAAQVGVDRRQHDRLAAELAHADLEGDPGAGRRLLEDHRQGLASQGSFRLAGRQAALGLDGHVEDTAQGWPVELVEVEKVL